MSPDLSISVLVPSYNAVPFIEEAIASVRQQLGEFDEVVLQDGGSNDGTVAVLRRVAEEDSRFRLVSENDEGQSDALNRALARARGSFVIWLNADDLLLPGAIDRLRNALRPNDAAGVAWGGHQYVDSRGVTIEEYLPERFDHNLFMRRGCYIFSGSIAIDRQLLTRLGGFASHLHYCMDLDLMFRLAHSETMDLRRVEGAVGALRWHDASKSGTTAIPFLKEGWEVRSHYMVGAGDHVRRFEALVVLAIAHATVGLRHTFFYRRIRRVIISPFTSVKTTAPRANGERTP